MSTFALSRAASATSGVAASEPLGPPDRSPVLEAHRSRLTDAAAAYATDRRTEALRVARAAMDAGRTAATVSRAHEPSELTLRLVTAVAGLEELTAAEPAVCEPAGADRGTAAEVWAEEDPRPVRPCAGPAARDDGAAIAALESAQALEEGTAQVFSLAFEVESAAEVSITHSVDRWGKDLDGLLAAVGVAETALAEISLEPLELLPVVLPADVRPSALVRADVDPRNGAIPREELCPPAAAPEALLRCDAAAAFDLLAAAYLADTGQPLLLVSSYRSFDQQVRVKAERGALAAAPGHSMHGVGVAIDVANAGGVGQFGAPVYLWLKENAADYGWYHPPFMGPGGSGPLEPWHWEFGGH